MVLKDLLQSDFGFPLPYLIAISGSLGVLWLDPRSAQATVNSWWFNPGVWKSPNGYCLLGETCFGRASLFWITSQIFNQGFLGPCPP